MAEQISFPDLLRAEIAKHEEALERNPTWIKLQAARRTLAAYEGPEPRERRAAPQPKCGLCRKPYSAHRDGNGADASGTITKIKLCPGSTTQTYEPETK
jgi:hypothetical protein